MAKYLVTSGSYFEPFTYDQIAAPVREAAQIHRATQDAYDQYSMEAEALRHYLDMEPNDSNARRMYDGYMAKLEELQNNLWANGYNAQTRRDLAAARAGYSSDITRLGTAIQTRQQRSAEYNTLKRNNPDLVMGDDPGLAGLDNYLADDLYGQNYFTYSGNQFSKEVGADIQARAQELLRDPRIEKNPELFGYLTRITEKGVTGEEINRGMGIIRALVGDDPTRIVGLDPNTAFEGAGLDAPTKLIAQVMLSRLQATGAAGKISSSEFNRLVEYGGFGLNSGIIAPEVKDFEDIRARNALELSTWKAKQDYSLAQSLALEREKARLKGAAGAGVIGDGSVINDKESYQVTGNNAKRAERRTKDYQTDAKTLITLPGGREITNNVDASSVVYSEDLRLQARERLGFDIGADPTPRGGLIPDKFLHGTITDRNGTEFEVRYNPNVRYNGKRGAVEVKTGRNNWGIDPDLTSYYEGVRKQYESNLNSFKNAKKGSAMAQAYELANIDPDKQARDYKKNGDVSGDVPLSAFKTTVMDQPGNYTGLRDDTYVARIGEDPTSNGYIDRVSKMLSGNFKDARWPGKGVKKDENRRVHKDNSEYIHEIGEDGSIRKLVKDADSVFTFDDNFNITNISAIQVSPESIIRDCIIVKVSGGGNKKYTININMLGSQQIASKFNKAKKALKGIDFEGGSETDKEIIASWLASEMRSDIGYNLYPQIKGNTKQDDLN